LDWNTDNKYDTIAHINSGAMAISCLYYLFKLPSTFERGIKATKKDDIGLIILELAEELKDDIELK